MKKNAHRCLEICALSQYQSSIQNECVIKMIIMSARYILEISYAGSKDLYLINIFTGMYIVEVVIIIHPTKI